MGALSPRLAASVGLLLPLAASRAGELPAPVDCRAPDKTPAQTEACRLPREKAYLRLLPDAEKRKQIPFFDGLGHCPARAPGFDEARVCLEAGRYRIPKAADAARGTLGWTLSEEPALAWAFSRLFLQSADASRYLRQRNPGLARAAADLKDGLGIDPARVFDGRPALALEPVVKKGQQGRMVGVYQSLMKGLGADLEIDEDFGDATRATVRRFQTEARKDGRSLPVNGIIDGGTSAYLIQRFQRKHGLKESGVVDGRTEELLRPSAARGNGLRRAGRGREPRAPLGVEARLGGLAFNPPELPSIPDEVRVHPRPGAWRTPPNLFDKFKLRAGETLESLFHGFDIFQRHNAYPLPLNEEGGYEDRYGYRVILARQGEPYAGRWGQQDVIGKIMRTASEMRRLGSREPLLVGDIGPHYGRDYLPGHDSHGSRRAVDFYFYRLGGGYPSGYGGRFDPIRNLQLVIVLLRDMRARVVLVDDSIREVLLKQAEASGVDPKTRELLEGKVVHWPRHEEHFHAAF